LTRSHIAAILFQPPRILSSRKRPVT